MVNLQKPADEYFLELLSPVPEEAGMTVAGREKSAYFGDVAVTFASEEVRIRLIADRGHSFAERRPSRGETEWFDLSLLEMLLTAADTLDGATIESQVQFLRRALNGSKDGPRARQMAGDSESAASARAPAILTPIRATLRGD